MELTSKAQEIMDLAKKHNVVYHKTKLDELANTFTKLSDDEVILDNVELTLIALKRAGVITGKEMFKLMADYFKELRPEN